MWDVEWLTATNRSFVLMPYSTQLWRMKFSGYIIWNSLSFSLLPTSTHIVTIFPILLHYFNSCCLFLLEEKYPGKQLEKKKNRGIKPDGFGCCGASIVDSALPEIKFRFGQEIGIAALLRNRRDFSVCSPLSEQSNGRDQWMDGPPSTSWARDADRWTLVALVRREFSRAAF